MLLHIVSCVLDLVAIYAFGMLNKRHNAPNYEISTPKLQKIDVLI